MQSKEELRAQNILVLIECAMPRVFYPHRKTADLYGVGAGQLLRCFQCEVDVPLSEFWKHIRSHGKQSSKKPIIVTDGKTLWQVKEVNVD